MQYRSSRGGGKEFSSKQAIIKGLADDGGLFVPSRMPLVDINFLYQKNDYKDLAFDIMRHFFSDFTEEELKKCIVKAYDEKFDSELIAPVEKVDDFYVLELFHGATSAFKDMALSILPHFLTTSMKSQKMDEEVVILTATSGDTGKAALAGFSGVEGCKIIVFYPDGGVSEIQRKQMVTQEGENVFVVAVKGNFDDAQTGVKKIFSDKKFGEKLLENGYKFSSANSINIGRLVPQIVYYFHAYFQLVRKSEINMGERIDVCVPTGNFGNILAAFYAMQMGLPIEKLIVASNDNNVLVDFIKDGVYDKNREFVLTSSPSMDILVSSNLERLLNFTYGDKETKKHMDELSKSGKYKTENNMIKGCFYADFSTVEEVAETISDLYWNEGYIADTHTAVAIDVSKKYRQKTQSKNKMLVVSTASPFKFPEAVLKAIMEDELGDNLSATALTTKLEEVMGIKAPSGILKALTSEELHDKVVSKEKMKAIIADILKVEQNL